MFGVGCRIVGSRVGPEDLDGAFESAQEVRTFDTAEAGGSLLGRMPEIAAKVIESLWGAGSERRGRRRSPGELHRIGNGETGDHDSHNLLRTPVRDPGRERHRRREDLRSCWFV